MHLKRSCDDDGGFTLVELIIVIAIIAVMSVVGLATVNMINSAKAKEAGVTLDSEVTDFCTKAKSQVCMDGDVKMPKYKFCLMIYLNEDGKYYSRHGYYNPDGTDEATQYLFDIVDNNNHQKGVSLSNRIDMSYTDSSGNVLKINRSGDTDTVEKVYIVFNGDGSIMVGDGRFTIYKKNGNEVTQMTLRKNGSHELK